MTADTLERTLAGSVPLQPGLALLADQVRLVRRPTRPEPPSDGVAALFEAELRLGLEAADTERAYEAAAALWRRSGDLSRCHRAISRTLGQAGLAWADGRCSVATGHRITATAGEVLARLRAGARPTGAGRVVLAAPPGDQHQLALASLAHLLEAAGWTADVVGDLPAPELARAARGAVAVVLSVHVPCTRLGALVTALRHAEPSALVVAGGPESVGADVDLVTSDPAELLSALEQRSCPLSTRERDVLRCVADGLTNAEAAGTLGIAAGTLKTHLDRIFEKTGASGRAAAVAIGLRKGWIA
jgi:DNA-binding CsgD family transcriptional regulator